MEEEEEGETARSAFEQFSAQEEGESFQHCADWLPQVCCEWTRKILPSLREGICNRSFIFNYFLWECTALPAQKGVRSSMHLPITQK